MNITKLALDNSRVTIMLVLMVVALGLTGYTSLSRNAMPPFTIRVASIVTTFPGASPERVEELVSERMERVAQELPEMKRVTSQSRTGLSVVSVELDASVAKEEMQPVWDKLRRKIEDIRPTLPEGVASVNLKDDGLGVVYGIQLGLSGEGYSFAELEDVAKDLRDDMVKLDDASEVEIMGLRQEQIYVEFDNARIARYGLSASTLQARIAATNIVFPGGDVTLGDERIVLEPTGNFESVDDLGDVIIALGDGATAKLSEIATITRGYKTPAERIVRVGGERGLVLGVAVKEGANLIQLGDDVNEKVIGYNQTLPVGMSLERIASQDAYVQASVTGFVSNVLQSVAIVLAVMFLFLGWRTGLVVASLIPLAIVATLMLMNVFDVGLNQVTLAALIMALGLLVDNAIVVSEAMVVNMENGDSPRDAAINATGELLVPLLISSLTTSAAFLAFFLAENTMGEMMGPLFVVISFALLSSWVLAMTVVAMLGATLIRVDKKGGDASAKQDSVSAKPTGPVVSRDGNAGIVLGSFGGSLVTPDEEENNENKTEKKGDLFARFGESYGKAIYWSLKRPWLIIGLIVGAFFGSLAMFGLLPNIFFPDSDRNMVTMNVNLPLGSKIEATNEAVGQIEQFIRDSLQVVTTREDGELSFENEGIVDFTSFVGEGPKSYDLGYQPGEANSGYAHLLINTTSYEANARVISTLEDYGFRNFPLADISVTALAGAGGGGDLSIRVQGADADELYKIGNQLKSELNALGLATNISDSWGQKQKKVVVNIDQNRADRAGVTNQDIAISLRTALSGYTAGSFREDDETIPIVMRGQNAEDLRVQDLESINVFAQGTGENVALEEVADVDVEWQYANMARRDLYRTLSVDASVREGVTAAELTAAMQPRLDEISKEWPAGYTYEVGGEAEASAEAMGAVGAKLPLAGFIIVLLLVIQFNSFRKMMIILLTIPLGIIGVIIGLVLLKSYFGFMAFLGVISLAGILINNAIVLVDRIEIEEKAGKTEFRAIVDAAKQRFRPILLTTFTTTLGLIPLYLGGGLMWEPMAIAIMIGLLFSTVITLIFVPVLYKLLFGIKEKELAVA